MSGESWQIILTGGKLTILIRLLFFGSILLAIGEFVFFIMSILSTDYVVGLYESTSNSNDVVKFNNIVTIMKPIILVISILVVVGLIYSVYYFY